MPSLSDRFEFDRRAALKALAGAASTLMAACSRPDEEIIPYVHMPEGMVPGEPMRFATTLRLAGYARGFLAISVDGHPIKIEGNPGHPFSLGATDVFAEAEVMSLYDPDRSRAAVQNGAISRWNSFSAAWQQAQASAGRVALVTGRIVSPTTVAQIDALQRRIRDLRWYRYEPVNDDMARAGSRQAFGRVLQPIPRWEQADIILLLDADPIGPGPDQLRAARALSTRRTNLTQRQRIFSAEPAWTLSGAMADVRCALAPGAVREVGRSVANALGANLGEPRLSDEAARFAQAVSAAFAGASGRVLVLAGENQPPEVHALAHWINERMNAPINYLVPADPIALDHAASLQALADDLHEGRIGALIIADANPVFDAPDRMSLGDAIAKTAFSAHLGTHRDETARRCQWHLPLSHSLESWGDGRALDGTPSLAQPLIKTLYDSKTMDEALALLADAPDAHAYDITRATWQPHADGDFENWWRRALHDGVIANSASQRITLGARLPDLPFADARSGFELVLSPDASLWDGRYANNAWLQECPKPFTRQVWGNAVQLAPADADRLHVADQDVIEIELNGQNVALPVVVTEGQAPGVMVTTTGYGRTAAGRIGNGVGARLDGGTRPFSRMWSDVAVRKSAQSVAFRSPQLHTRVAGKAEELLRVTSATALSGAEPKASSPPPSLLPLPARGEYAWAMVINTDACIGCNACVVACQAENNVPVVGPSEISQGRDMHWLRVDGYTLTGDQAARSGFQPVPCMHCELAPCEPVCPVEASVHDHEGLNVQVYNRCIGTRFCQANCPYKVRRFNWFAYAGEQAYGGQETALRAQHNPDVSARGRGVMEKCNYCLQRINRARHAAEREGRRIAEGEIVTACQAACPTRAIHFGDLNQADGVIARMRLLPQHYALLEELNTRPRTTYLKRIYNDGATT